MTKTAKTEKIDFRVSKHLKAKLMAMAAQGNKSMAQTVIDIILEWFAIQD